MLRAIISLLLYLLCLLRRLRVLCQLFVCLLVAAASLLPDGRVGQREEHTKGVSALFDQLRQVHLVSSESLLSWAKPQHFLEMERLGFGASCRGEPTDRHDRLS